MKKSVKNKKQYTIITLILSIISLIFISTIAYSAFSSTMHITGIAHARPEANVRITDFRLATTNNATSSYEEFSKTNIVSNIDLKSSTSSITYYLEITNYGSVDVGIFDIIGLPSGVNYSIKDYKLHDKICNDEGKCNSFIKKTYELTLTSTSPYSGNIQMGFDFRIYYKIKYTDITNHNYPTEVINGGNVNITFKEDLKRVQILSNNKEIAYYKQVTNNQTITLNNVKNDVEVKIKEKAALITKGNIDTVGSEVCIGKECFYIISNDGTTVTMLAKYNLYVGGSYDGTVWTKYGNEATGMQDKNMLGWTINDNYPHNGITAFSNTNSTYSGSIIEEYVNNYKNILESNYEIEVKTARLITYDELTNSNTFACTVETNCSNVYPWIYSTSYWSGSQYDASNIWNVNSYSQFNYDNYDSIDESGVRPVIEISVDEIAPLVRIVSGDYDTVGSEVCIGEECFYVISSTEETVTMLAKYNLLVGNRYDDTNYAIPLENPTGIQDETAIAYFVGYTPENPAIGTIRFSSSYYWASTVTSYPAYVYNENSILYNHVENYKTYLTNLGKTVEEARIITLEEVEKLGCSQGTDKCKNAPKWVYSTTYWTGTAAAADSIWRVYSDGDFLGNNWASDNRGVRPVITINKT